MTGLTVVTKQYEAACRTIEKTVEQNTWFFAKTMANQFWQTAQKNAPWTDRKGHARANLYGHVGKQKGRTVVKMGGYAPNYKPKSKYEDYMELLEWGHESLGRDFPNLAIIYPTFETIKANYIQQYGAAVFGGVAFRMIRSKEASRARSALYRERRRNPHWKEDLEKAKAARRASKRKKKFIWEQDKNMFGDRK